MSSYDQWKTASPFDDDPDLEFTCTECGCEIYEITSTLDNGYELECQDCGAVQQMIFDIPDEEPEYERPMTILDEE